MYELKEQSFSSVLGGFPFLSDFPAQADMQQLVDKMSGTLDVSREDKLGFERDHSELCKFNQENDDDDGYQRLKVSMKRKIDAAMKELHIEPVRRGMAPPVH